MKRKIVLLSTSLLACLCSFPACSESTSHPETIQTYIQPTLETFQLPSETTRKIVGYTSDDVPIYEDEIYTPKPFYYDEYGTRYILQEGTFDSYYMDEDYQEEVETPESSAFEEISYWPFLRELRVVFRNSGSWYVYYEVPAETWWEFKNADSKGSYFNEQIKGQFECDRE